VSLVDLLAMAFYLSGVVVLAVLWWRFKDTLLASPGGGVRDGGGDDGGGSDRFPSAPNPAWSWHRRRRPSGPHRGGPWHGPRGLRPAFVAKQRR